MIFPNTGSQQKNAAPMQSMIKKQGLGQQTPNPFLSAKSPASPNKRMTRMDAMTAGMPKPKKKMTFLDPVFMYLMSQYF